MINRKQRRRLNTRALKASPWASGFTLIETLVAIVILTTAIAGPLTIAAKSFMAATVVKDQITAFYLAQDAVEYIRFKRDTNRLAGSSWLTGLDGGICTGATGCYLDSTGNNPANPTFCPGTCQPLRYDTTNNRFTYTGGTATIFKRTIVITTPVGTNADEASITVTVSWSDQAGITRSVVVLENMFNWQ